MRSFIDSKKSQKIAVIAAQAEIHFDLDYPFLVKENRSLGRIKIDFRLGENDALCSVLVFSTA